MRTPDGISLNIDNDTIKFDTSVNKLSSNINIQALLWTLLMVIFIWILIKKMKLNINNYVDDNVGSTIVMNTQNKISVNITHQQAGEVYLGENSKLKLRLGPFFLQTVLAIFTLKLIKTMLSTGVIIN